MAGRQAWWLRYAPKPNDNRTDYSLKRKSFAEKIGKLFQEQRKAKISRLRFKTAIAEEIGISRSEYSNFEDAKVDMPYSNFPLLLELLHINPYKAVRAILPTEQDEYIVCRNRLLDLMLEQGMDISVLDPLYPVGTTQKPRFSDPTQLVYHSTPLPSKNDSSDKILELHDDPTMAAVDFMKISEQVMDLEEAQMFKQNLIFCVFHYWANINRKTPEYELFWDAVKDKLQN